MAVIIILIVASLVVALGFLAAFLWSVNKGQYDDVQTPAIRILFDDTPKPSKNDQNQKETSKNQKNNGKRKIQL